MYNSNAISHEALTYLENIRFEGSHITRLITEKYENISPIAWKYFSSETQGYTDVDFSLSKRIWTAVFGAVGTILRTIGDLFIRTLCLFNYKSDLSIKERCKQLFLCVGRDLGKLGGYVALPFTNKAFHWINHNDFQRKLLLIGNRKNVLKYTLSEIARNNLDEPMNDLAESCGKEKLDHFVDVLLDTEVSRQISDITFLTEDFDVDDWMDKDRFLSLVKLLRRGKIEFEEIKYFMTEFEKKGKYGAALHILVELKHWHSEKFSKLPLSEYLSTIKEEKKSSEFVELIKDTLPQNFEEKKKTLFSNICQILVEEEKSSKKKLSAEENRFMLCSLKQMSSAQQDLLIKQVSIVSFLETKESDNSKESKRVAAYTNILTYVDAKLRDKVTARLLTAYCGSGKVDRAIDHLRILDNNNNKKEILQMALKPFDLERLIGKHKEIVFKLLKDVEVQDKNIIFEILAKALCLTTNEPKLIECLKGNSTLLLYLFGFLKSENKKNKNSKCSLLLWHCVQEVKRVDLKAFNEKIKGEIPGVVEELLKQCICFNFDNQAVDYGEKAARAITYLLDETDPIREQLLQKFK